ncbi:MAG: hypothetical protein ABI373_06965, partial [Flavobacteriales bacterium]
CRGIAAPYPDQDRPVTASARLIHGSFSLLIRFGPVHGKVLEMITTNLPQLVQELNAFGTVNVHDHIETIDLEMPASVPMDQLDDLICDAIFADPLERELKGESCVVHLGKRSNLRGASDMHIILGLNSTGYVLDAAA